MHKIKQRIINKKLKLYDMEINTAGVPYRIPNIEEEKAEMISIINKFHSQIDTYIK